MSQRKTNPKVAEAKAKVDPPGARAETLEAINARIDNRCIEQNVDMACDLVVFGVTFPQGTIEEMERIALMGPRLCLKDILLCRKACATFAASRRKILENVPQHLRGR